MEHGVSGVESEWWPDILVRLRLKRKTHTLICEVMSEGAPRRIYATAARVLRYEERLRETFAGERISSSSMLLAPYLSPQSRQICRDFDIGYMDLEGNTWLTFDNVYIDRIVPTKPKGEIRGLKFLFNPKSARILRAMLKEPQRQWRITELADICNVSTGHVGNIRKRLIDEGWAKVESGGLMLMRPSRLLDAWRENYRPPKSARMSLYTRLHGRQLEKEIKNLFQSNENNENVLLSSFSAAKWMAPYTRISGEYFYADVDGLAYIARHLDTKRVSSGANVFVDCTTDDGIFIDKLEISNGLVCTGTIQTYLDLDAAGERGAEAAEYLREEKLQWLTE